MEIIVHKLQVEDYHLRWFRYDSFYLGVCFWKKLEERPNASFIVAEFKALGSSVDEDQEVTELFDKQLAENLFTKFNLDWLQKHDLEVKNWDFLQRQNLTSAITGYTKWDGCTEWRVITHSCTLSQLISVCKALVMCRTILNEEFVDSSMKS